MIKPTRAHSETTPPPRKWWAMLGIGLGIVMFTLDTSIVNIALPTLVQAFGTSFATVQWVVLSYTLVITALVLVAARLGDMYGKKRLYLTGLIIFTISSLLCGLAPSITELIGFRALQGLGAVFISALGAAIITEVFPESERGKALGIIGTVVSVGISLGPSVGGLLIGIFGWRLMFLVNVPIGIFASFVVAHFVPPSVKNNAQQRFDGLGALILAATLTCFALGMTHGQNQGFGNGTTLILLAFAVVGSVCFLAVEARLKQPMLNLSFLQNLPFSLSLLASVLVFIVIAGIIFILPFFLELVLNYSIQHVGLLLMVSPILTGIVAPMAGSLSDRFGQRLISFIGLILMACGCLACSTFDTQLTDLGYILRIAPFGVGLGMFQSPNNSAVLGKVPQTRLGIASGLLSLSRTLGRTTGVPLLGALFATWTIASAQLAPGTDVTAAPPEALVFGVQGAFRVAALFLGVAAVLIAVAWRRERK